MSTSCTHNRVHFHALASLVSLVLLLGLTGGCKPESEETDAGDVGLEPPERGVQYVMEGTIEAYTENEQCKFFVVGDEGLAINRTESHYTGGSHHMLLYSTPYEAVPTENLHGEPVDTSDVFDCSNGPILDWQVNGVVAGAQTPDAEFIDLPPNTALIVEPGTVLLMNTHYLNASEEDLHTRVELNIHTLSPEDVEVEAGVTFWYDQFIYLPPQSSRTARMICPVTADVTLVNVQSHMHKRGVGFQADLLDENSQLVETIYTSSSWEFPIIRAWEQGYALKQGQKVDFWCDYENNTDETVLQGLSADDEMCMILGLYYPRVETLDWCGPGFFGAWTYATYIGDGEQTCGEALSCFAQAKPIIEDGGASLFPCITNTCPAASEAASAVAQCSATAMDPATDCAEEIVQCTMTPC